MPKQFNVDKRSEMLAFWSARARQYGADPRANTPDVYLREIEIDHIEACIKAQHPSCVLDFGCANGFTTLRLAAANSEISFTGVDLNSDMIEIAQATADREELPNVKFKRVDIIQDSITEQYDLIYAVRVFQNLETPDMQKRAADNLIELLKPSGLFLYIESYAERYQHLNNDRKVLGLAPLPIHEHLTLLERGFDKHVADRLLLLKRQSIASSYYLITRLAYSYMAKVQREPIDYDHPLHQVAARVPQIGDYGPLIACLYRNEEETEPLR